MSYTLDPELAAVLIALGQELADMPVAARGDWRTLRANGDVMMAAWDAAVPVCDDVETRSFVATAEDGRDVGLRWYTPDGPPSGSAIVYAHGGGMILGSPDLYENFLKAYVSASRTPFLSVDYRLAPGVDSQAPVGDVVTALAWLIAHAKDLHVDSTRIAVMGDSAGGGIAAGAAIRSRDRGIELARQILVYPMLDDRTQAAGPGLAPFATWSPEHNATGWEALLGPAYGTDQVPAVAAPARLHDASGLAPAYLEVGDLDILRDECVTYARLLMRAAVPVELHVHPGAPHSFDRLAPKSGVATRAMADRLRVIRSL